eukprot:COSAG01_NODE_2045_length_8561_cov_6.449421_4_plen_69_part_00
MFGQLPRRFGHAATDRQSAYLSATEIETAQRANPLEGAASLLVRFVAIRRRIFPCVVSPAARSQQFRM